MNSRNKIRLYFALEVLVWLLIIVLSVGAIRFHSIKKQSELKTYQIFMQDVDGLIEGSPVRMMGVPIGYIKTIRIVNDQIYVKFVLTNKGVLLPKGVIATVEFNGMAGSKSLELYSPNELSKASGNLIEIKSTNRLGTALGLLDDMFAKLGSIMVRCGIFSDSIVEMKHEAPKIPVDPVVEADKSVDWLNQLIHDINYRRIQLKNMMHYKSGTTLSPKEKESIND